MRLAYSSLSSFLRRQWCALESAFRLRWSKCDVLRGSGRCHSEACANSAPRKTQPLNNKRKNAKKKKNKKKRKQKKNKKNPPKPSWWVRRGRGGLGNSAAKNPRVFSLCRHSAHWGGSHLPLHRLVTRQLAGSVCCTDWEPPPRPECLGIRRSAGCRGGSLPCAENFCLEHSESKSVFFKTTVKPHFFFLWTPNNILERKAQRLRFKTSDPNRPTSTDRSSACCSNFLDSWSFFVGQTETIVNQMEVV